MAAKKKSRVQKAYNAMKKMDPTSVVREGEMLTRKKKKR